MTTAANILWALDQMAERPLDPEDQPKDYVLENEDRAYERVRQEGIDDMALAIADDLVRRLKRGDYSP